MTHRRGNNEGSIYRRKDGRWVGALTLLGGKRKAFYGRTRQAVNKRLTAALKARADGLPLPSERLTVAAFLSQWLDRAKTSVGAGTWERYEAFTRVHVVPAVGKARLVRLTPDQLQQLWSDKLSAGLAPATVRQMRAFMRKALNDAGRWGLVARNVAALTSPPKVERAEIRTLSVDDVRALFTAAAGDRFEALYVLAVSTGMRQGELLGLHWQDIDMDQGAVKVRRTLHKINGSYKTSAPKSGKSRQVALTQIAIAALRRHKGRQAQERLAAGGLWPESDLVFTNEVGTHVAANNLRSRSFRPLLDRAGLTRIRFHDLRHTAATLMLGRRIHPKVVSEMLGHSQIATTLEVYSHVTPTMQSEAAAAMDSLLTG